MAPGFQDVELSDHRQLPDEDTGTPAFLEYHRRQLQQCGVQLAPGGFKLHDLHKETLNRIAAGGKKYRHAVVGLTPHSVMPSSAGWVLRLGFVHKQSTLDRDCRCTQNKIVQVWR